MEEEEASDVLVTVFPSLMCKRREFFLDSAAFVVFLVFSVETEEEEELSEEEEEEEELSEENNSKCDEFFNICRWANVQFLSQVTTSEEVLIKNAQYNIPFLIDAARRSTMKDSEYDQHLTSFLTDPEACVILDSCSDGPTLLVAAVEALLKRSPPILPLVMPLSLEVLARKFLESRFDFPQRNRFHSQFCMQLLYALLFLDRLPSSPFVIDPHAYPVREALRYGWDTCTSSFPLVEKLARLHCPEVLSQLSYTLPITSNIFFPRDIKPAILNSMSSKTNPLLSSHAESVFLFNKISWPFSDVYREAAVALLSSTKENCAHISYSDLCHDPLVLLQCSSKTWRQSTLRRILLSTLEHLILVNEIMVRRVSVTSEIAEEYLAARNVLIIRCFLILMSGSLAEDANERKKDAIFMFCPMMIAFVRTMVTTQPGLIATIVKQGANDVVIDWIVAFIPESFSDSRLLKQFLESKSLSAVERLKIADFSLRIVITYGKGNEGHALPLAYSALSVLISSFYLVVGPVGVPVNVVCDDEGRDITLLCRKPMFRMIASLQAIDSKRAQLRNEAVIILQKLMNLCKSDVSGLTGTAAAKRKAVLKEIYDASMKSIASLGGNYLP